MTLMARLLAPRVLNLLAFLACVVAMAGALYLEHVEGLDPCPLCIFQRVGVIVAGLFFFLALIHNPAALGQRLYGALAGVGAIGGGAVAARHVWLQSLPPDKVPACGPALDYMLDVFPMTEVLRMVLSGSGECATIDWLFLGLSLPAWSLIVFIGLTAVALFQLFRRYA
jgi:protein dithiol:quinone oxidoreductase